MEYGNLWISINSLEYVAKIKFFKNRKTNPLDKIQLNKRTTNKTCANTTRNKTRNKINKQNKK